MPPDTSITANLFFFLLLDILVLFLIVRARRCNAGLDQRWLRHHPHPRVQLRQRRSHRPPWNVPRDELIGVLEDEAEHRVRLGLVLGANRSQGGTVAVDKEEAHASLGPQIFVVGPHRRLERVGGGPRQRTARFAGELRQPRSLASERGKMSLVTDPHGQPRRRRLLIPAPHHLSKHLFQHLRVRCRNPKARLLRDADAKAVRSAQTRAHALLQHDTSRHLCPLCVG
mmetsp:Transcript_30006/g.97698  ORF Transcript_30006/g.97698 Transcript_30006/m.97698 type:complete len:227 (-) Transcript_30006:158-838(-)